MTTLDIQKRLKVLGFDPGPLDGYPGRRTSAAVRAFQRANGLVDDGIAGPLTLAALFPRASSQVAAKGHAPWLDLARRKMGLHEGRDRAELAKFLKSDGKTLGDPATRPWCGDFVETCLATTLTAEALPANPYLARNWLDFGQPTEPTLGAIAVYWRKNKQGSQGHVAFVVGDGRRSSGEVFYNLGGNQSDAVTVTPIAKERLLGCRWPTSVPVPAVFLPRMKGGKLSVDES